MYIVRHLQNRQSCQSKCDYLQYHVLQICQICILSIGVVFFYIGQTNNPNSQTIMYFTSFRNNHLLSRWCTNLDMSLQNVLKGDFSIKSNLYQSFKSFDSCHSQSMVVMEAIADTAVAMMLVNELQQFLIGKKYIEYFHCF